MSEQLKQAFIFAAGRGERMMPLTTDTPKPLVKVNNRPIIDYTLQSLLKIDSIQKIIINGYYLSDKIESYIKSVSSDRLIFSKETEKLETGGGLIFASDKIDFESPLLIINGDLLWLDDQDLQLIWQRWLELKQASEVDILLGLKRKDDFPGYKGEGDFNLLNSDLIDDAGSPMSHAYVGIQIIDPKILSLAHKEKCFSMSYFYRREIDHNNVITKVKGIELPGKYFHVSEVADIKNTENLINNYAKG